MLGGTAQLARKLQVPMSTLDKWLAGEETPPNVYFFRAVDVVLDTSDPPEASASDPSETVPRDAAGANRLAE
jgi:hypothetical protein